MPTLSPPEFWAEGLQRVRRKIHLARLLKLYRAEWVYCIAYREYRRLFIRAINQ